MADFKISYIGKDEAMYLLGHLRHIGCTNCPDFYKGCSGNSSQHDTIMMDDEAYLHNQIPGTELHLCGKLRNIINLGDMEEQNINSLFQKDFNEKLSIITKQSNGKFAVVFDKAEVIKMKEEMEKDVMKKVQKNVQTVNQKNEQAFKDMVEHIESSHKKIKDQERLIKKLKQNRR